MLNIVVDITDTIFRAIGIVTTSNWLAKNVIRIVSNRKRGKGGEIMTEEKKKYEHGKSYTVEEMLIEQFKILHDTSRLEETTVKEKVELSFAMVRIAETL